MPWICADCGAEYDERDPPCRECGGERFAELAAHEVVIDSMADVDWACKQCGRIHQRNNPPCTDCGGMQFTAVEDTSTQAETTSEPSTPAPTQATPQPSTPTAPDSESDQTAYYLGILGGLAGLVFLPFIFWFVAIVESPLRVVGRSIQNVLPAGASTNDGVTGSFQVFAWAGHASWALAVLAFVVGALLGLAL